jgi:hypothetical protein
MSRKFDRRGARRRGARQGRKHFFFEKKKQKTFDFWFQRTYATPIVKSFLLLFFKKEDLPS